MRRPIATDEAFVETLISAAQNHGKLSELDHEVGDLQQILRICWKIMTPAQRTNAAHESWDIVEGWEK